MKTSLGLKTSQQLALTPQLQQSIKLLQMSTVELREELESTILQNPLLEFEENTDSSSPLNGENTKETPNTSQAEIIAGEQIGQKNDDFGDQKMFDNSEETSYKNNHKF